MRDEPNWSLLESGGVRDVALQAAKRISNRYASVEQEEMQQEALILIVTNPNLLTLFDEPELNLGKLQHGLEQRLTDGIRTQLRRESKQVPLDPSSGDEEYVEALGAYVPEPALSSDYTREAVEVLLPAVWDEAYCYGLPAKETVPDPDMPKGSAPNVAHGNNLSAYIADVKTGWQRAPLTRLERRAILMTYGLYMTHNEIAQLEGVARPTITTRLHTGVGKITARLNGGIFTEEEQVAA